MTEAVTKEEMQQVAFGMIAQLGLARQKFTEAITASEQATADQAQALLQEGNDALVKAHKGHFGLIQREANGEELPFSLILTHAEDQLMTIELMKDLGERIVSLNLRLAAK